MFTSANLELRWKLSDLLPSRLSRREQRPVRWVRLHLEELETRALLSAGGLTATPLLTAIPQANNGGFTGFTPQQIQNAYSVTPLLNSGTNGAGQTIAIVDAFHDPNILADANAFSSRFNLTQFNTAGGPTLKEVTPDGSDVNQLATDPNWAVETALDVEWAHAIAPNANILLVEAPSDNLNDLFNAVSFAGQQAGVVAVSMSWGTSEFAGETALDSMLKAPGVTYVASSGDYSAFFGPIYPASSPNVLAVGGTSLHLNPDGSYSNESAWFGSGGGFSSFENAPSFQSNIPEAQLYNSRTTPDVALDANPNTGLAVFDSFGTQSNWLVVGGTSAGAPQWAAIVALADQARGSSLDTSQVETTLYNDIYSNPTAYSNDFHDVTSNSNGYRAGAGYDLATGLGTPIVSNLVADLVAGTTAVNSTGSLNLQTANGTAQPHFMQAPPSTPNTPSAPLPMPVALPPVVNLPPTAPVTTTTVLANNNVLTSFNLQTQGVPTGFTSSPSLFGSPSASSSAQLGTVFGASGWAGSSSSLRLSASGIHGPTLDAVVGDLANQKLDGSNNQKDEGPLPGELLPLPKMTIPMEGGEGAAGADAADEADAADAGVD